MTQHVKNQTKNSYNLEGVRNADMALWAQGVGPNVFCVLC